MTERLEETNSDKLERVRLMTEPDSKWDLSPKDVAALKHLLAEVERLKKALEGIRPFVSEDFHDDPDEPTCASDEYRNAYKQVLAALAASREAK